MPKYPTMPIWVWYAKQPYGWTLANLTSIPQFSFSMSEESLAEMEDWELEWRERQIESDNRQIKDFIEMLENAWETKIKMTSEVFKTLPRKVQLAIINLHGQVRELEYQIDEIRSIIG